MVEMSIPCVDNDSDWYGSVVGRACVPVINDCPDMCASYEMDCNDNDEKVHPGAVERPFGNPICSDNKDNDCDGMMDGDDEGCQRGGCGGVPVAEASVLGASSARVPAFFSQLAVFIIPAIFITLLKTLRRKT